MIVKKWANSNGKIYQFVDKLVDNVMAVIIVPGKGVSGTSKTCSGWSHRGSTFAQTKDAAKNA